MGQNQSSRSSSSSRVSQSVSQSDSSIISHDTPEDYHGLDWAGVFTLFIVLQTAPSTPDSFPHSGGASLCLPPWLISDVSVRGLAHTNISWEQGNRGWGETMSEWGTNLTTSASAIREQYVSVAIILNQYFLIDGVRESNHRIWQIYLMSNACSFFSKEADSSDLYLSL